MGGKIYIGIYQMTTKVYQMAVKWTKSPQNMCQYLSLQDPQKLTQIGFFVCKNLPSRNPAMKYEVCHT
jgi:hypothetical protein